MFKSSERLRQESAQRSLDRVASSWRQSRTTWFDGTPQSIEARLAETGRVLTVARSGYSPAHLELTVEAERARRELLAAQHHLMTDFLDDGARAFKGSRRVARQPEENENWEEGASYAEYKGGKCTQCKSDNIDAAGHGTGEYDCYDCGATFHPKVRKLKSSVHEAGDMLDMSSHGGDSGSSASLRHRDDRANNRYTIQKIPDASFDGPHRAIVNHDDTELMSADGQHHWASRRIAFGLDDYGLYENGEHVGPKWPADLAHHLTNGSPHASYDAGYDASWHPDFSSHDTPWEAAEAAWDEAGGHRLPGGPRGSMDGFGDGWVDAASDIPHQFKDPKGYAEYFAQQNGGH
jgi:hypothetical protein